MKFKSLKFLAPEGDAGGGEGGGSAAAVADPLAGDKPAEGLVKAGELWKDALAKAESDARGEKASDDAGKAGDEGKGESDDQGKGKSGEGDKDKKAAAQAEPASALDAQFNGTTPSPDAGESKSLLEDLPETLPREGRADHWKNARGAITTLEGLVGERNNKVSELTAALEAAKTAPPEASRRIAELEKELGEWKDLAVAANIDLDPAIREKHVTGRANKVARAASKLNAYGGDGSTLTKALEMPEGRLRNMTIKEALGDLEDVEKTRIMTFVAEVEQLDDELAEIKKNPQPEWEKLQKVEQQKLQKKQAEAEDFKKTTFESVFAKMADELFLLRKVPDTVKGAAEANAQAEQIRSDAFKTLAANADPAELVKTAVWGKAGPVLQKMVVELRRELSTALATIAGYDEARPGFEGRKASTKEKSDVDLTPGEIYKREIGKSRGVE